MVGRRLFGFVPVGSWFGRAEGLRTKAFFPSEELGCGGLCPHPPRNLRFLGTSFCCRLFGRWALLSPRQAQAATSAAQRRRLRTAPHQKRTAAGKPPPRRRSPRHFCAAAVGCGHRPPASATACKLSLRSLKFPQRRSCQTKPSLMEGSSTMMKWPTSRMVS